jgi:hypothetical protein
MALRPDPRPQGLCPRPSWHASSLFGWLGPASLERTHGEPPLGHRPGAMPEESCELLRPLRHRSPRHAGQAPVPRRRDCKCRPGSCAGAVRAIGKVAAATTATLLIHEVDAQVAESISPAWPAWAEGRGHRWATCWSPQPSPAAARHGRLADLSRVYEVPLHRPLALRTPMAGSPTRLARAAREAALAGVAEVLGEPPGRIFEHRCARRARGPHLVSGLTGFVSSARPESPLAVHAHTA